MSATRHGNPGEWAKVKGTVVSLWPLFVCFLALGALGTAVVVGRHVIWFAAAFFSALALTAFFWRKGLRRVESYFKGARGEERVAALLDSLPTGWHVFHDFPAGKYHVDHVVVGPMGVFSLETKNWNGRVTVEQEDVLVDGVLPDRSPLQQAWNEANAVKEALKRAGWDGVVEPVLCMASDMCVESKIVVRRVNLLNARDLLDWLSCRSGVLAASQVTRLAQLMETHV